MNLPLTSVIYWRLFPTSPSLFDLILLSSDERHFHSDRTWPTRVEGCCEAWCTRGYPLLLSDVFLSMFGMVGTKTISLSATVVLLLFWSANTPSVLSNCVIWVNSFQFVQHAEKNVGQQQWIPPRIVSVCFLMMAIGFS